MSLSIPGSFGSDWTAGCSAPIEAISGRGSRSGGPRSSGGARRKTSPSLITPQKKPSRRRAGQGQSGLALSAVMDGHSSQNRHPPPTPAAATQSPAPHSLHNEGRLSRQPGPGKRGSAPGSAHSELGGCAGNGQGSGGGTGPDTAARRSASPAQGRLLMSPVALRSSEPAAPETEGSRPLPMRSQYITPGPARHKQRSRLPIARRFRSAWERSASRKCQRRRTARGGSEASRTARPVPLAEGGQDADESPLNTDLSRSVQNATALRWSGLVLHLDLPCTRAISTVRTGLHAQPPGRQPQDPWEWSHD
ncbi:hypothetical protein SKAU_G00127870 [Synaphobranchus kaupii]|uniref:Uncharacterized protein n=1 Tax=Synaphobranchus kaupii TaxID=118154 RepID=A0A9Q1FPT2_SYNKA|nr:hypothetical protein SKAU_G00127870 [Synaphobranchus kaupii]